MQWQWLPGWDSWECKELLNGDQKYSSVRPDKEFRSHCMLYLVMKVKCRRLSSFWIIVMSYIILCVIVSMTFRALIFRTKDQIQAF